MPAAPRPAPTPEAAIRAHYGLSQAQLARYLGVSAGFVAHLEASRKALPVALEARLLHLAPGVPPPAPAYVLPPLPPPAPLPATAPLALRRRHGALCLLAHTLGQRLARQQARVAALAARHAGLARLQALPAPPAAEATHWAAWLARLAQDLALAPPAPPTTAAHLLAARLAGVRAELAVLAQP